MTATTAIALPTAEMVQQFRAFATGKLDLNPVLCTSTVYSKAGNVIVPEGHIVWANGHVWDDEFISVWTEDTHYAHVKSATVPSSHFAGVDACRIYCGWDYVAEDITGNRIERYNRSFTELVVEHSNLVVSGYRVVVTARVTGEVVDPFDIPPSWMLEAA